MANRIKAGSFSRLSVYSECPKRAKLAFVDKVPELERPALPGGKEHANDRGHRIHEQLEHYVRRLDGESGSGPTFPVEALSFKDEIERVRALTAEGVTETENLWTFNDIWEVCDPNDRDDIWLRVIIDAFVWLDEQRAVVIDYKTGKRVRNEVKHAQQGQLYMLSAFLRYPKLQEVTVEFWYLDQDEMYQITYSREQGLRFLEHWNKKMVDMTTDEEFIPKPNAWSCRFCPYKTGEIWKGAMGTGDCDLNP